MHFCPLDKECRAALAPWRVSQWFGKTYVAVALRPGDGFVPPATKQANGKWKPSPPYRRWNWRLWISVHRR